MSTVRGGKPYIWATWIAKLLGGDDCAWAAWFRSRHDFVKFDARPSNLAIWARDHNALVAAIQHRYEADGWTVTTERQNAFTLDGRGAILSGRPDLICESHKEIQIVDAKTGHQRDADFWQVLIYLYALGRRALGTTKRVRGVVEYATHEPTVVEWGKLQDGEPRIIELIRVVSQEAPPRKVPSRGECVRCPIGPADCPERVDAESPTIRVEDF